MGTLKVNVAPVLENLILGAVRLPLHPFIILGGVWLCITLISSSYRAFFNNNLLTHSETCIGTANEHPH